MDFKIKFFNFILYIIGIFIINTNLFFACVPRDARFSLVIGNLDIDFEKINIICTEETCKIYKDNYQDGIVLRSSYDNRVAIIISRGTPLIKNSITIKTPYEITDDERLIPKEIIPEEYNWKESIVRDLSILKNLGVIKLSDEEIENIGNIAENDKNILFCKDTWKKMEANCFCDACVKCIAPAIFLSLPEKSITYLKGFDESNTESPPLENPHNYLPESPPKQEDNREIRFLLFIIAIVVILSLIVSILLFFARIPSYE